MTQRSIGTPVTTDSSTFIFRSVAPQSFSRISTLHFCWKLGGAILEAIHTSPPNGLMHFTPPNAFGGSGHLTD